MSGDFGKTSGDCNLFYVKGLFGCQLEGADGVYAWILAIGGHLGKSPHFLCRAPGRRPSCARMHKAEPSSKIDVGRAILPAAAFQAARGSWASLRGRQKADRK